MKFSLLLPIHIGIKFNDFKKSFDSLINQKVKPSEFIIILDGPVKGLIIDYIKLFKKKNRIKLIRNIKNIGLGASLKKGILISKFNLIIRADSDVIYNGNRNKEMILFYLKNKSIDIFGSWMLEIDESQKYYQKKTPHTNESIYSKMNFRNPINHPTVMFKKSKIILAGNYKHMPFFEDYYLWLRCKKIRCKFLNIKSNLATTTIDLDYVKRRHGLNYFLNFLQFQTIIYKENLVPLPIIIINIFIRLFLLPLSVKLRLLIYKYFLRNS
jgi:glycosyltransferase involved in cell wall biosynthesis